MRASIVDIFPGSYDAQQTRSSVEYIGRVDEQLIEDGTYLVVAEDRELIACGGWSRRDKLFSGSSEQEGRTRLLDPATEPARVRAMFVRPDRTRRGLGTIILEACQDAARASGFRRLSLMATLPGIPLYERFGFRVVRRETITLPDGVTMAAASMDKPID
jgi:GNAT superfamily N-acetyltransferase